MKNKYSGFTLAELLIALAILGVISAFTIPKVLMQQEVSAKRALAKEYAGTISHAYQLYKNDHGGVASGMRATDLLPYMNYIRVETQFYAIDNNPGHDWLFCGSTNPCVVLANGGYLFLDGTDTFGGTGSTNALLFHFDPDGTYQGGTSGPGKGVVFLLYYNGKITTMANMAANTCSQSYCPMPPEPTGDPTWFQW